jgi:hypothetical protein
MNWADLDPELRALAVAVISAIVATVVGYLEKIRRDLAANTEATHGAKVAAEGLQRATFDRLDYDRLRRLEAALLTLDECAPCRQKILDLTDRRRLRPHSEDIHHA